MSLSIIIPTLNEEKYVGRLLGCLAKQSYRSFEVIVVDGGSEDDTRSVVMGFRRKLDMRFFVSGRRGVSYQRNVGAGKALHDRLLFLDADAALEDDFLERSMEELQKRRLELASARMRPDLKRWYYDIFFRTISLMMSFTQFFRTGGVGACIFVKKDIFEKAKGFDTRLKCVNDHDFIRRAGRHARFRMLSTDFIYSVRRFEKHGTKKTMKLWGKEMLLFLIRGPVYVNKKISYKYNTK